MTGKQDFSAEQIAFAEKIHKGAVDRPAHDLTKIEGMAAVNKGCRQCHDVGRPNEDGSIGTCTACHARHVVVGGAGAAAGDLRPVPHGARPRPARDLPRVEARRAVQRPARHHEPRRQARQADNQRHARAHLRHLPHERTGRGRYRQGQDHAQHVGAAVVLPLRRGLRPQAELRERPAEHEGDLPEVPHQPAGSSSSTPRPKSVVRSTNKIVNEAKDIVEKLRKDKLLTEQPFDEPIEYLYFDLWHYGGRTAKHGAYMGGADFVQWHGYYEIVSKLAELKKSAADLRKDAKPAAGQGAGRHQKPGGEVHATSAAR